MAVWIVIPVSNGWRSCNAAAPAVGPMTKLDRDRKPGGSRLASANGSRYGISPGQLFTLGGASCARNGRPSSRPQMVGDEAEQTVVGGGRGIILPSEVRLVVAPDIPSRGLTDPDGPGFKIDRAVERRPGLARDRPRRTMRSEALCKVRHGIVSGARGSPLEPLSIILRTALSPLALRSACRVSEFGRDGAAPRPGIFQF